jgi:hypothetical protein
VSGVVDTDLRYSDLPYQWKAQPLDSVQTQGQVNTRHAPDDRYLARSPMVWPLHSDYRNKTGWRESNDLIRLRLVQSQSSTGVNLHQAHWPEGAAVANARQHSHMRATPPRMENPGRHVTESGTFGLDLATFFAAAE